MHHANCLLILCFFLVCTSMAGCGCDDDSDSSDDDRDIVDDDADDDVVDDDANDDLNDDTDDDADDDLNDDADDDADDDVDDDDDDDVDVTRCITEEVVHVSKLGTDEGTCGGESAPCLTIGYGLGKANSGDAVCVHSGIYNESFLLVPGGVTLISADGALEAKIFSDTESAVRFTGFIDNAGMDGFEVYGTWDQGSGDGLIRVYDATNINIRNTMAHDAPHDQDVIKVSGQVSGLIIEGVVAWNPGHRTNGVDFQEVIDIFGSGATGDDPPPVSNIIVRGCWLFHTEGVGDWIIYSKIYAEKILYENNIFGPSAGMGPGNPGVGIGTSEAGIPNPAASVVTHAIVRNNIFVGIKGDGAFSVMNSDDTWVYNNTFYANSGTELRSVIMLRGNTHELGDTRIFNNVFLNNHPSKNGNGTFFWVRNNLPDPWFLHNNLFHDNIAVSDTPYTDEPASIYDSDPGLSDPAIPDITNPSLDRIAEIKADFAMAANSSAVDAGVDAVQIAGHPNWSPGATDKRWDYEKDSRPADDIWDLGADEVD